MNSYNIPYIIKLLSIIDRLHKKRVLVIQQLLEHVELGLEEQQPGGSIKLFCHCATFNRYLRLVRLHAPDGVASDPAPFRGILRCFSEEAVRLIETYLEQVSPGILSEHAEL